MNNVIKLSKFKNLSKSVSHNENIDLSFDQVKKLENLRDGIEKLLNTATAVHGEPLGVGLAAGRYAAMNLEDILGKDEAIKFFKDCIKTSKINKN